MKAFRCNPADGSFAALAFQSTAFTNYLNEVFSGFIGSSTIPSVLHFGFFRNTGRKPTFFQIRSAKKTTFLEGQGKILDDFPVCQKTYFWKVKHVMPIKRQEVLDHFEPQTAPNPSDKQKNRDTQRPDQTIFRVYQTQTRADQTNQGKILDDFPVCPGQARPGRKPRQARPGQDQTRPGQARPGQARPGQARPGQARPGQARPGQARPGQARPGQARPGQARPGQARPGQARPGQATPDQTRRDQIRPL